MKKIKIISIVIGVILLIVLGAGGFFVYRTQQSLSALNTSDKSVSKKIDDSKPFSILLLGADTGTDGRVDRGNSDTMMLDIKSSKEADCCLFNPS